MTATIDGEWALVCSHMRDEIGDAAFDSWFKPMSIHSIEAGTANISVPTRFMRDWIANNYLDQIRALWSSFNAQIDNVEVIVANARGGGILSQASQKAQASRPQNRPTGVPVEPTFQQPQTQAPQMTAPSIVGVESNLAEQLGAPLDPRYTFPDFVVGKPNEFAHAASKRVAEAEIPPFNPLFLYGGVGLGRLT